LVALASLPAVLLAGLAAAETARTGAAEQQIRQPYFVNSLGMAFKRVPAGRFTMGSPPEKKDRNTDETPREVEITVAFLMGVHEVTQAQWRTLMGDNPSRFRGDDLPVEQVTWHAVKEFIRRLNDREGTDTYRLPTEAEWEYACRSGTRGPFAFGDCLSTRQANYNGAYPYPGCAWGRYFGRPIPVGSLAANAFGLYDMHGNVSEWCQDSYRQYHPGAEKCPAAVARAHGGAAGDPGGNWYLPAYLCRSANRDIYSPDYGCDAVGFRLVKSP
jgi:sulfatase modifying factor 1